MARVQIIGTKRRRDKTVQLLQRLGTIQIDAWSEGRAMFQQRMTLSDEAINLRERLAYTVTHVEAVLAALPPVKSSSCSEYENYYACSPDEILDVVTADLAEITPQVQVLTTQGDQLEEQLGSLPRYETILRRLLPLVPALIDLEDYMVTAIWVERRYYEALTSITRQLEELTEGLCEVIFGEMDQDVERLAAVLIFPKTHTGAVNELLGRKNITQARLPAEFSNQPLEQALSQIRQRLQAIPGQLAEIRAQQEALAQPWRPRLLTWQALLQDYLAQIDVCPKFGQTDYTFVIEGWVPEHQLVKIETALAREVGDDVMIVSPPLIPSDKEQAPVMFDNPRLVKPFESLVELLALPKYAAVDPTPLMAIFMPIFFGLMVGDIGYGAIILALMFCLRRRFKARFTLRSLTEVLMIGSIWSIFFGLLFGEFFGTLGETIGLQPLWFDRGHQVQALFLLTLGIGAGHIVLGLCLGLGEAIRQHNHHNLIEKVAMLVSLAALFLLVTILAGYLPESFLTPAIGLLLVGLAILIFSLGRLGFFLGPLELVSLVSNILSYLRIAAIGLASVYLAMVANALAGFVGNILVGLIIAVLFHALNIVLGAFSPTIQSLRLHYVEFFSKFYQGGGQAFRPFQRSISMTEYY
jgi:V/A-type H+-transporting ATPase subunit I